MRKTVVAAFAAVLLVGGAGAVELTQVKEEYVKAAASTNPVDRVRFRDCWGGDTNVALFAACDWDTKKIVDAVVKMKSADALPWQLTAQIGAKAPLEDKLAYVVPLAQANGKKAAVSWAQVNIPAASWSDGVFSNVFAVADRPDEVYSDTVFINELAMKVSIERKKVFTQDDLRPADYVRFLLSGGLRKYAPHVADCKQALIGKLEKAAKKKLRDEGKTFVTRNGVNQLEAALQPVVAALNAPKLEGLEAALAAFDIQLPAGVRDEKVWAAVAERKDAIMFGEIPAEPLYDGSIIVMLGPDGYNAWVKEFNEGAGK
ncbi:MAG: hypothetical protein WCK89_08420 [bacterium]